MRMRVEVANQDQDVPDEVAPQRLARAVESGEIRQRRPHATRPLTLSVFRSFVPAASSMGSN